MDSQPTEPMRSAVAAGDFRNASRLWDDYAAAIRAEICDGTCSLLRMAEAREFLEWARQMVLSARAQAQDQLNAIRVARHYGPPPAPPASFLRTSL